MIFITRETRAIEMDDCFLVFPIGLDCYSVILYIADAVQS